ncbi:MAG: hypothetical protein A4E62_02257 [Syntrophorhabdus sp. PtaU1.Bin002]|nr:MAG: hypothetical protein A4E58_00542 [Syntrophorhabdus sp. PtaB.Bin006]OPY67502.1 MAG: hypothetical protein A4E62_02257 [Syntrophorhabdus sp. PtaU1.Bin002]
MKLNKVGRDTVGSFFGARQNLLNCFQKNFDTQVKLKSSFGGFFEIS